MVRINWILAVVLLLRFLDPVWGETVSPANRDRESTLVYGKVSDNPKKQFDRIRPLLDHVVHKMGDVGIHRGDIKVARNNRELIQWLKTGQVDWVGETPFSALHFTQEGGAEIFLRCWKGGADHYSSILFVRKDQEIKSLGDLPGKTVAFEDGGSTASFFIPMAILKSHGLQMTRLKKPREPVPQNRVGYVFAGSEINVSAWVASGLVDAGALSDKDWVDLDDLPPNWKKEFRILHQSSPVPRALELVRGDLPVRVKTRLKEVLLSLGNSPEDRHPLRSYYRTTGFSEIDGETETQLAEIGRLFTFIRDDSGE
jgi:phosphonate transport system substrate-binding protein